MANYDTWGQSSRGLLNDFSLQSYGGEAVPLSTHAHSHVPSEIEFSEIDLSSEPPLSENAKVRVLYAGSLSWLSPCLSVQCHVLQIALHQMAQHAKRSSRRGSTRMLVKTVCH